LESSEYLEIKEHAVEYQNNEQEIQREIKKSLRTIKSGNTTHQNLEDLAKAVFRGKFIAINVHNKKKESS
jgi:hypothetical protein